MRQSARGGPAAIAAIFTVVTIGWQGSAWAFPPYRSTDAETADPWTIEARLGLLRWARHGDATAYSSPLLRLNLGLPRAVELLLELEHEHGGEGLTEAAVGCKWVPVVRSGASLGIETLVLLPVEEEGGTGIEASLLTTFRRDTLRVHLNVGGFYADRLGEAVSGWRAGAIVEWRMARIRPGFELFARRTHSDSLQVLAGPGIIIETRHMDIRLGLHLGVTSSSPDVVTDTWVASKWDVRSAASDGGRTGQGP